MGIRSFLAFWTSVLFCFRSNYIRLVVHRSRLALWAYMLLSVLYWYKKRPEGRSA